MTRRPRPARRTRSASPAEPPSGRRRSRRWTRSARPAAVALALVAVLAACAGPSGPTSASDPAGADPGAALRVALLLPESATARYETHDRPAFERRIAELCPGCEVLAHNAGADAARQQTQVEAAVTNGADVLVLDPVDSVSAAVAVRHADAAGVPVVSYDREVIGAPVAFHVTFDNRRVGALQAASLVGALEARGVDEGRIVVLNGATTDANSAAIRHGAEVVLEDADVEVGAESDVAGWAPDAAQEAMERAIATLGRDAVVGVLAANDGIAGGAIAAMRSSGLDPLPPVTGQDADLAALRRIVTGDQHMTVYKAFRTQAEVAAEIAVTLARDGEVAEGVRNSWTDGPQGPVPTLTLEPRVVRRDNLGQTVLHDGFVTREELCAGIETACAEAGW